MSWLRSIAGRLYRGEVSFDFVGRQKLWYTISGLILVISIAALAIRGLDFSVDFKGGAGYQFPAGTATSAQVAATVAQSGGPAAADPIVQSVHGTSGTSWQVQTGQLTYPETVPVQKAIAERFGLPVGRVSVKLVGPSWGNQITHKAAEALIAFLIVIVAYLSIAFEWRMAAAAFVALAHDIVITVGVYALTGFEVSPASVIGLLTILGYSLYDTVVVFDKVRENTVRPARDPAVQLQPGGQPGTEPDPGPVHQHLPDRPAAGHRHPGRRRQPAGQRRAEGPVPGAVRRHAVRHVLVDLHRDARPGRPERA